MAASSKQHSKPSTRTTTARALPLGDSSRPVAQHNRLHDQMSAAQSGSRQQQLLAPSRLPT
jgi:hypothetical protein